jgi:hypothetical protein
VKITLVLCISLCCHLPSSCLLDFCFSLRPIEVYMYLVVIVQFAGIYILWSVRTMACTDGH